MRKISKESIIMDVLMMDKLTANIFHKHGMQCLGCPSSSGESIEEACAVHGVDVNELVDDLNAIFIAK